MSSAIDIRRALVLSGGGALGAYQAGALAALRAHDLRFEAISAASIGVLHALAWNRGDMVLDLREHWRDNVRRLLPFDARRLLRLRNPFQFKASMDGVVRRYRDSHPRPDDAGQVPITVSLTEASTGANRLVDTSDPSLTDGERVAVYKAATAIPALGDRPVRIWQDHYYDGGFTNNLPVEPFLEADLDEVWLIPLFPDVSSARWKRPLARAVAAVRRRARNPWILGASGLMEQGLRPTDLSGCRAAVHVIRPADPARLFTLRQGLTFSVRHIDRLHLQGRLDADAVCQRYRESRRQR